MNITHPTLYVFAGEMNGGAGEITHRVERIHPLKSAFFLTLDGAGDDDATIRCKKAQIQLGEGGLNIKRVNIYVITQAQNPWAVAKTCGQRLRAIFREDFAASVLTMTVLLNESNEGDDFEARNASTYKFLSGLAGEGVSIFDRVFLLSDRNENDIVSPLNRKNAYDLLAYLPMVQESCSYFDEVLAAKKRETERMLFASAGLAMDAACDEPAAMDSAALSRFAQILQQSIDVPQDSEPIFFERNEHDISGIKRDITSVAATSLKGWNLLGLCLDAAEDALFGDGAARFFAQNHGAFEEPQQAVSSKMHLRLAAKQEMHLRQQIIELSSEISCLTQELSQKKNAQCPPKTLLLPGGIDHIKDQIAECYAITYQISRMKAEHSAMCARHQQLKSYIEHIRQVIEAIKNLPPEEEKPTKPLAQLENEASINISLLRDDGLIREKYVLETESPCVIRLVGGFVLEDLSRYGVMRSGTMPSYQEYVYQKRERGAEYE